MKGIRILKVKLKDDEVFIEYQKVNSNGGFDDYSLCSSDKPRPEFKDALFLLAIDVVTLCELPEGYKGRILVQGVTFSYGDGANGIMGATISSVMQLFNATNPLCLNTPHKKSEAKVGERIEEALLLPASCVDRLRILIEECGLYISGERAQGDLFGKPGRGFEKMEISMSAPVHEPSKGSDSAGGTFPTEDVSRTAENVLETPQESTETSKSEQEPAETVAKGRRKRTKTSCSVDAPVVPETAGTADADISVTVGDKEKKRVTVRKAPGQTMDAAGSSAMEALARTFA